MRYTKLRGTAPGIYPLQKKKKKKGGGGGGVPGELPTCHRAYLITSQCKAAVAVHLLASIPKLERTISSC